MKQIRRVYPGQGKHGWVLTVEDVPPLPYAVTVLYDALLTLLGSPCCGHRHGTEDRSWAGWISDHLPGEWLKDRFSVLQYRLMSNRISNWQYSARTTVLTDIPLTRSQARALQPEFVDSCDEIDPPTMVYISLPTLTTNAATLTWSNGQVL